MEHCATCKEAVQTRLVHEYRADLIGAPFPVILLDAVKEDFCQPCGKSVKTVIPDLDGLLHVIALTRALFPRKLSGPEIKFLRHALGWKAKDVAERLDMSAENWSRVENGAKTLGPQSEKIFRAYVVGKGLTKEDLIPSITHGIAEVLTLKIETHWDPSDVFELHFKRCRNENTDCSGSDDGVWVEPKAA